MSVAVSSELACQTTHILHSFGATYEICAFLEPLAILKLQLVSPWLYTRGISRIQTRWKLRKRFYFAYGQSDCVKHTVFVYDVLTGQAKTTRRKGIFNFHQQQTIQIGPDLYSVAWEKLQVTKFKGRGLTKVKLASGNVYRQNFSLAADYPNSQIYLTGGRSFGKKRGSQMLCNA